MRQSPKDASRICFDRALDVVRFYITQSKKSAAAGDLTARLLARRVQQELRGWLGIKRYEVDPLHLSFSSYHLRRRFCVAIIVPKDFDDLRIWQKYFEVHDNDSLVPLLYLREPTVEAQKLFPNYLPTDCDLEDLAQALVEVMERWESPFQKEVVLK